MVGRMVRVSLNHRSRFPAPQALQLMRWRSRLPMPRRPGMAQVMPAEILIRKAGPVIASEHRAGLVIGWPAVLVGHLQEQQMDVLLDSPLSFRLAGQWRMLRLTGGPLRTRTDR